MTLSGNWRVSLMSASGLPVVPDVVELILDGKSTEVPVEGKKGKDKNEVVSRSHGVEMASFGMTTSGHRSID
jgi:hypothetical protein